MAKEKPASTTRDWKGMLKRVWRFLWYEDSVASWVVSILLAFILIKFVFYPLLGVVFGTQFPVVAVVSNSMEHESSFDGWWGMHEDEYLRFNITKSEFTSYPLTNGFNKGDIILLVGIKPDNIRRGMVIVYWGGKQYPIIHRVVAVSIDNDGQRFFQTKGDHNNAQIISPPALDETHVRTDQLLGKAVLRVPYLGWVKIAFVSLLNLIGIPVS